MKMKEDGKIEKQKERQIDRQTDRQEDRLTEQIPDQKSGRRTVLTRKEEAVLDAMLCMTRQCWEQGITAQTLMELGEMDRLTVVVHDMVQRQGSDGRLCVIEDTLAVTDSAFCIPAVYETGRRLNREDYVEAAQKNVRFLLEHAQGADDGTLYHISDTTQVWADSAAYLPYALALTGHVKEGYAQMEGICRRLYDPASGLYFHMWEEETQTFLRALPWGVGNGWILTGMLRLYLATPQGYEKEREALLRKWRELLEAVLARRTENSLFCDILDDPGTFEESECSEMVAYAIYRAIREGLLETSYRLTADEIRCALEARVDENGLVTGSAGSPDFAHCGTAVESQAHYLMMEHAARECPC